MKKLTHILLTFVFQALLLHGQDRSSTEINVSVIIKDYIEITTISDIDAGSVTPSSDILRIDPRTDSGAGIILLQGQKNKSVVVNYSPIVEMTHSESDMILVVNYEVSGSEENIQSNSTIFLENPEVVQLSDEGEYYLYIGCSFSLEEIRPGQYDGDFVVEVDYN